jgi:peptidylprolyl isomerase
VHEVRERVEFLGFVGQLAGVDVERHSAHRRYDTATMRALAVLFVPLFACSSSESPSATPAPDAQADVASPDLDASDEGRFDAGPPPCPQGYAQLPFATESPATHTFKAADAVLDATKDTLEVLDTDQGRITWRFRSKDAPVAANSFVFLTLQRYFEGQAFHRVIDGFMAQSGDPNSLKANTALWGRGGPGYAFDVEVASGVNFDAPGVVGMANAGMPTTTGSQFFVTFVPYPSLNGNYTVVGNVIDGLDVLPKIVRGEPPKNPTRILAAYVCVK